MKRILLVVAVLALVAAACSGSTVDTTEDGATASTVAPSAPSAPSDTVAQEQGSDSTAPTDLDPTSTATSPEAKPPPEGPPARDFTLALEPTGEFVLSQEVKPVYMVFWAEW